MSDFTGHRVMITAGAAGIGKAIAGLFARHGALVHVVDIDHQALQSAETISGSKDSTIFSQADVADEPSVKLMFEKQLKYFQGIDTLINCAGIKGPTGPVEKIALEDWRHCLDVNLQATFLCSKYAIPHLKQQGKGTIINLSSTAGWHGYPLRSPYAAAKWAVIGFTKSLAMELGPFGVRANAICPGSVSGERMDRVITDEATQKQISEDQVRLGYTNSVSMRTFIEPEDIADTALFLASKAASKITGQALSVDGNLEDFGGLDK